MSEGGEGGGGGEGEGGWKGKREGEGAGVRPSLTDLEVDDVVAGVEELRGGMGF